MCEEKSGMNKKEKKNNKEQGANEWDKERNGEKIFFFKQKTAYEIGQ